MVQIPRFVPLSVLHITSPKGPQPFLISLPSRKDQTIHIYVFVPPNPIDLGLDLEGESQDPEESGEWHVPVVLDFHGGGFIMGSPLEQAPYAAMMARELGAVVISVSYRIGPFNQFPAAVHDAEDVLSAILDKDGDSKAGKILRTEIQRYYSMVREAKLKSKREDIASHYKRVEKITLDPTHLAISGFSAGGNLALNMAISVPPCADYFAQHCRSTNPSRMNTQTGDLPRAQSDLLSPGLPPARAPTVLDDVNRPWKSLIPPPCANPTMFPLLLFYPSLDARLLPHERPQKPMPNALNADDKTASKPRMPGLFSIMGPTYLPKKLRAHPRASPGLNSPENIAKNAAILLVLPENDSLAVQSDVWVDGMNQSDWNGPVRFGDGREGDWDGNHSSAGLLNGDDHASVSSASMSTSRSSTNVDTNTPDYPKSKRKTKNGGLEVWHAPGCRHGWTQFPDLFVGKHERAEREKVFSRTLDFVKENWKKELAVKRKSMWSTSSGEETTRVESIVNGGVNGDIDRWANGRASLQVNPPEIAQVKAENQAP